MDNTSESSTKVEKFAVALFAFMQQCGLRASVTPHPNEFLTYQFTVSDMTNLGVAFGISFNLSHIEIEDIPDTPKDMEAYCFGVVVKIGTGLLIEKANRLCQYQEESQKSRIILPGQ